MYFLQLTGCADAYSCLQDGMRNVERASHTSWALLPANLQMQKWLVKKGACCIRQEASITWCDLFWPKFGKKMPKFITSHDVLELLKQVLSASRDAIISGQICGSKLQRVFTLGDGCWLPMYWPKKSRKLRRPPKSHGKSWDLDLLLGRVCDRERAVLRQTSSQNFLVREGQIWDRPSGEGHLRVLSQEFEAQEPTFLSPAVSAWNRYNVAN